MFLDFFETYLPAHLPPTPLPPSTPSPLPDETTLIRNHRATLLTQALQHFSKTPEYTTLHATFLQTRRIASATHLLRPVIASATGKSGSSLSELLRAMRRHCAFRGGEVVVLERRVGDAETEIGSFVEEGEERLKGEGKVREWIAAGGLAEVKERERRAMKESRGET